MQKYRDTSLMFNTFPSFALWVPHPFFSMKRHRGLFPVLGRVTRGVSLFLAALSWVMPSVSMAATNVSGTLTTPTVWSLAQSPINLQGDVVLDSGAALTIEPGVQVHMQAASSFTLRRGSLQAVGTAAQPIVITSANATPAPGDWGQWRFLEGTNSAQTTLDNVRIEYGSGLVVEKSSPTLNRVTMNYHKGPAIRTDLESSPVGQGLSATGNEVNAIAVPAGSIQGQVVWGLVGIPYWVEKGVVMVGAAPMAIEPAKLATTRTVRNTMRVVFSGEAPPIGTAMSVTSSNSSVLSFWSNLVLRSPGGVGQSVDFEIQPYGCGDTVLTVAYANGWMGRAHANLAVECLPTLELLDGAGTGEPATWGAQLPYGMQVQLSKQAPPSGQLVYLTAPSNDLEIPASVTVPAGQTSVAFVVKGVDPTGSASYYGTKLRAQALGYEAAANISLNFEPMRISAFADSPVTVGDSAFIYIDLSSAAPKDGLRVLLASSDPSIFVPQELELLFPEGETYARVALQSKRAGQAQLRVYVPNLAEEFVDVTVVAPATMSSNTQNTQEVRP